MESSGVPDGLNLSGTPLNACILNAMNFIPEYRSRNKIQNLNVVFVTDGASNHCSYRYKEGDRDYDYEPSFSDANIMFVDPITKKQFRLNDYGRDCMSRTNILIDMLKDRTQCNILGFYITGSNTIKRQDMWWKPFRMIIMMRFVEVSGKTSLQFLNHVDTMIIM